ncbi:MAG TPA: preprotein translocase subunit SecG [Planctomycetota bacterium]|jgi:protein translocase SecG subunit|nr:preprotein translocase subunit SecG [Planctomycetota bacterium]
MIALLAAGGFLGTLLGIFFVIICLLLIFMVVITPSQEGGMAAAFGGMGSDSFFGTKAHSHINKFTVFLAVSFLVLAFFINWTNKGGVVGETGTKSSTTEEKIKNLPPSSKPGDPGLPPAPKK